MISHPPHRGALAFEMLDELLVGAVFEQKVSVLFIDDGVFQLIDSGETQTNVARGYRALPTYDVNDVFVDGSALKQRGLAADSLRNTGARALARRHSQTDRQPGRRGARLMATLHIINASSERRAALDNCLRAASPGDTVLLVGNGVFWAVASMFEGIVETRVRCHVRGPFGRRRFSRYRPSA